jgi:hypothetical protein
VSVAAILWLMIGAALLLAFARGGKAGVVAWIRAKFIGTAA